MIVIDIALHMGAWRGGILTIRIVSGEELRATLEEVGTLSAVAERYAITPVTARKVLNDHGLAFDQRLVAEWDAGASLNVLSRRHGPKPETISGWLKEAGAVIPSGNHRRTVTREELIAANEELKSIGKAAKAVGIARNTASKWLVEAGKASARKHTK